MTTTSAQPLRDDTFSPVKLPEMVSRTPGRHEHSNEHFSHNSPEKITAIAHGLANKHGRRATVHAYPARKLVNTPLLNPRTSPDGTGSVDVESIRRAKRTIDDRLQHLGDEKENKDPHNKNSAKPGYIASLDSPMQPDTDAGKQRTDSSLPDSSPLKKRLLHTEKSPPRKISKIVSSTHPNQVNEVFYKEDLIADLKSQKPSLKPSLRPSLRRTLQRFNPNTVIDNDSDSDPEDYGRIENTISQTIIPAAGGSKIVPSADLTQVTKVSSTNNYITPQRPTEPVAVSPATNQLGRINEGLLEGEKSKDSTSPLKNMRGRDNVDTHAFEEDQLPRADQDEPTINMLMSPNSKPVFSVYQLNQMQSTDRSKIETLRETIRARDSDIITLHDEIAALKRTIRLKDQQLQSLSDAGDEMMRKHEILQIQLKHNERELASLLKSLKQSEANAKNNKAEFDHFVNECAELKTENLRLLKQSDNYTEEKRALEDEVNSLRIERSTLLEEHEAIEEKSRTLSESHSALSNENKALTKQNQDLVDKCDKLEAEKDSAIHDVNALREENDSIAKKVAELRSANESLQEINAKQEELLKELDNLEGLANDKIYNLEKSLSESMNEHTKHKKELNNKINDLSNEILNVRQEKAEIESSKTALEEEIKSQKYMNRKLDLKIESLEMEIESTSEKNQQFESTEKEQQKKINELQALITQKESIISEDIVKLNELVEAIEVKKQSYEQQISDLKEQVEKAQHDQSTSAKEAAYYKEQVKLQEADAQKKLDDVATFLHKLYAEKHTRKLGEVRDLYERELSTANQNRKTQQREVDLLRRKLNRAMEEVQMMTELMQAKGLHAGTSPNGSPMKSMRF